MALRFRRGLDIERQAVVFVEGEPTYTTDNKEFFIGDGVTPGGIQIGGINSVLDDTTPRLGGNLDLNSNNIIGSGDIEITGNLKITGTIDVGKIEADYTGSLFGDDSTLIVDAINHRVYADVLAMDGEVMVDSTTKEVNLKFTSLESLQDVEYTNPSAGAILTWNGTAFSLGALGQIDANGPLEKQLLQYDMSIGWVASDTIQMADSSVLLDTRTGTIYLDNTPLDSHGNVLNLNLQIDDVLAWDGVNWINKQLTIENAAISLDSLDDTVINNISPGDVLEWNGTFWTNMSRDDANVTLLDELDDVVLTNVIVGDVLTFDGANWASSALPTSTLDDLDDVAIITENLSIGDIIAWDGTNWVSSPNTGSTDFILSDLDDVIITENINIGDVLTWDGTNWTSSPSLVTDLILNDLDDVIITENTNIGDVLKWDGTSWTPQTSNIEVALNEIEDVIINDLNIGDVLKWDGTAWHNVGDLSLSLNDLLDVNVPSANIGDVLLYDGTGFSPTELNLSAMEDIFIDTLEVGDILQYDGINWRNIAYEPPSELATMSDTYINDAQENQVLTYDGTGWINKNYVPIGDHFAADGDTKLIDGTAQSLYVQRIDVRAAGIRFKNVNDNQSTIVLNVGKANAAVYGAQRENTSVDLSIDTAPNVFYMSGYHDSTGEKIAGVITGTNNRFTFGHHVNAIPATSGNFAVDPSKIVTMLSSATDIKFGVGTDAPAERLDVVGNAMVSGFMQFGSMTAVERDALTATNGMVIYNSDADKFQGYAGGAWVDLH